MKNITFSVVAIIVFSITHAKDVSAVSSSSTIIAAQSARADNGIHLDMHTHVHRQTLSGILKNVQHDRPLATTRAMKKASIAQEKKSSKLRDGLLGLYIPLFS